MFQYKTAWTNAERFLGKELHVAVLAHDTVTLKRLLTNPKLNLSYIWEPMPCELGNMFEEERQIYAARAPVVFKIKDKDLFRELLRHPNAYRGIDNDYRPGLYTDARGDTIFHAQILDQTDGGRERFKLLLSDYPQACMVENNVGVPLYQSVISNERVDLLKEILKADLSELRRNDVIWAIITFAPDDQEKLGMTNKMLDMLSGRGWDFNTRDAMGATPLHWAARIGNEAMIEVLLLRGCDSEQKDSRGLTYADELLTYNRNGQRGYNLPAYKIGGDISPEKRAGPRKDSPE
jgi:hypothetical protein